MPDFENIQILRENKELIPYRQMVKKIKPDDVVVLPLVEGDNAKNVMRLVNMALAEVAMHSLRHEPQATDYIKFKAKENDGENHETAEPHAATGFRWGPRLLEWASQHGGEVVIAEMAAFHKLPPSRINEPAERLWHAGRLKRPRPGVYRLPK